MKRWHRFSAWQTSMAFETWMKFQRIHCRWWQDELKNTLKKNFTNPKASLFGGSYADSNVGCSACHQCSPLALAKEWLLPMLCPFGRICRTVGGVRESFYHLQSDHISSMESPCNYEQLGGIKSEAHCSPVKKCKMFGRCLKMIVFLLERSCFNSFELIQCRSLLLTAAAKGPSPLQDTIQAHRQDMKVLLQLCRQMGSLGMCQR